MTPNDLRALADRLDGLVLMEPVALAALYGRLSNAAAAALRAAASGAWSGPDRDQFAISVRRVVDAGERAAARADTLWRESAPDGVPPGSFGPVD